MRNNLITTLVSIIFLALSFSSTAKIRLPNVLASNMVIQQKSEMELWGWGSPGEKVIVTTSWNNKKDSVTTTGNANWRIKISTPSAGGPFTITFKGQNTITLENIMVGEVWVCSGQSNMEWSSDQNLKQIIDELPKSDNPNIRLFHIPKRTSTNPQDNCEGEWKVCGPESLKGFSAVGYFFGKKLQQQLNVPIGLINSSWGGTPAETWTPTEVVVSEPTLKLASEKLTPAAWWPVSNGYAYNAMIAPITNFPIAGAIWYQGESNVGTASTYEKLLTSMIDSWRKAWKKEFPFYFVQIAPFDYGNTSSSSFLREQQSRAQKHPRTGMVVVTDLVDNVKDIHPTNKLDVGLRLANLALGENYKQAGIVYKYPTYRSIEMKNGMATLSFENVPNGFTLKGTEPMEFWIAGEDKVFKPAKANIAKDKIVVWNDSIKDPKAVRFGFYNTSRPNVFSKEGLPLDPFRTDDWQVDIVLEPGMRR